MAVKYPRCFLSIGGVMIPCISAQVSRKAKRAADTFSAEFSATAAAKLGWPLSKWADFEQTEASVVMSSEPAGGDQRTMVTGMVDTPEIDWKENKISVRSRDKSASLTEKKRSQKSQNKKSADIVQDIAQDHGLTVSATSGDDNAGQMYDQDTAHHILNRSDYEVLNDLAEREGYRWYVDGSTLYFEPDDQTNGTFSIHWVPPQTGQPATANIPDMKTKRNMTAARPQKHTAKSWHKKDKKLYTHTESLSGSGNAVEHEHHHQGLNQAQVTKLAKSRLKNAARHDMQVSISDMPGDLTCDVRMTLQLSGTGTIYDQSYDIDEVGFEMGWDGFKMSIEAKGMKAGRS